MNAVCIETPTHGRVLIDAPASGAPVGTIVALHGYAQSADEIVEDVRSIPGLEQWTVAAPQALHRFYTRRDERVVASWMTRQDRDEAIADNIEYVNRAVDAIVAAGAPAAPLVFLGFSQGVAMAYRAALRGRHAAAGIVVLAGDVAPDVQAVAHPWPRVLVGAGDADTWYTAERLARDERFFAERGVPAQVVRFAGGHAFTDAFRHAVTHWLAALRLK